MYRLKKTRSFEKSYKKIGRSGKLKSEIQNDLDKIVNLLIEKRKLPAKFKDHQLKGAFKDYRECHIRSDLLLVYRIVEEDLVLVLIDIGSHSYLGL